MKIKIKLKTAFKKRFRLTGKGKIKRWRSNSSHLFYPAKRNRSGPRKLASLLHRSDLKRFRRTYREIS